MESQINSHDLARRLARTIASDLVMYHQEQINASFVNDDFFEALADALREGAALYKQRVSEKIAAGSNHFEEALVDVIFKGEGAQISSPIW